jgi:hypothetical protein
MRYNIESDETVGEVFIQGNYFFDNYNKFVGKIPGIAVVYRNCLHKKARVVNLSWFERFRPIVINYAISPFIDPEKIDKQKFMEHVKQETG